MAYKLPPTWDKETFLQKSVEGYVIATDLCDYEIENAKKYGVEVTFPGTNIVEAHLPWDEFQELMDHRKQLELFLHRMELPGCVEGVYLHNPKASSVLDPHKR